MIALTLHKYSRLSQQFSLCTFFCTILLTKPILQVYSIVYEYFDDQSKSGVSGLGSKGKIQ